MNVVAKGKMLSKREISGRTTAGLNAIASTEMEGLPVSDELRSDLRAWSHGEMTIETIVARTKARHIRT